MVNVGQVLEGAFGLIRTHWVAVAIWAGVYLLLNIVMLLTLQPLFQGMGATMPGVPVGPETSVADRMGTANFLLPIYGVNLVMSLIGIVLYAAAMRGVLRPAARSFGFLRFGGDELRLLLLLVIFAVAGMALMMGWGMLIGVTAAAIGAGTDSFGAILLVTLVASLLFLAAGIFLLMRFSLAFPLTLHRKRIALGEAWRLSKGHFWTLFGAALVVTLIGGVLMSVIGVFTAGGYLADLAGASGDAEAVAKAAQAQMARVGTLGPVMIAQSMGSAVAGAIWIALSGGSAATAAKLLLASEFDDAEAVFG